MKKIFFLLCLSLFSQTDIIYLKNGEEISANILEITEETVFFLQETDRKSLPRDSLLSIDLQKRRAGGLWKSIVDIDDTILLDAIDDEAKRSNGFTVLRYFLEIEKDNGLHIKRRLIGRIEDQNGKVMSRQAFDYLESADFELIHFRSIAPDGRIFHLNDAALELGSPWGDIPEYNRLKRIKAAIGEAGEGSIIDFMSEEKLPIEPGNPSRFELPKKWAIARAQFTIPADMPFFINGRDDFFHQKMIAQNILLEANDIPPVRSETFMPPEYTERPELIINPSGKPINQQLPEFDISVNVSFDNADSAWMWMIANIDAKGPDIDEFGFRISQDAGKKGYANLLERALILNNILNGSELILATEDIEDNADISVNSGLGLFKTPIVKSNEYYIYPGDRFDGLGSIPITVSRAISMETGRTVDVPEFSDTLLTHHMLRLSENDILKGKILIHSSGNTQREIRKTIQMTAREKLLFAFGKLMNLYPLAELDSFDINLNDLRSAELALYFSQDITRQGEIVHITIPGQNVPVPQIDRYNPVYLEKNTFICDSVTVHLSKKLKTLELPQTITIDAQNAFYNQIVEKNEARIDITSEYRQISGYPKINFRDIQMERNKDKNLLFKYE